MKDMLELFLLRLSLFSVFNVEVIQDCLEIILHQQTGITEITRECIPFFQAAVIEQLVPVINDKWDDPESETFLKKDGCVQIERENPADRQASSLPSEHTPLKVWQ